MIREIFETLSLKTFITEFLGLFCLLASVFIFFFCVEPLFT
tara:strand:- start:367 stop:489 length:123 start_codon:yes stop_codon:yes gene_type:complete